MPLGCQGNWNGAESAMPGENGPASRQSGLETVQTGKVLVGSSAKPGQPFLAEVDIFAIATALETLLATEYARAAAIQPDPRSHSSTSAEQAACS